MAAVVTAERVQVKQCFNFGLPWLPFWGGRDRSKNFKIDTPKNEIVGFVDHFNLSKDSKQKISSNEQLAFFIWDLDKLHKVLGEAWVKYTKNI